MDAIKSAFLRVKEDMDKMLREIEQIKDIQGVILDKIGVEAAALDIEEMEDELDDSEDEDDEDLEEDDEDEDLEEEVEETSSVVEGNFIATKTGKRYHVLTCNLVKNIAEKNKLMFDSSEDAEEEGLLQCHCIKKANN